MKYSLVLLPAVMVRRFLRIFHYGWIMPLKTRALAFLWKMSCGRKVVFIGRAIIRAYERNAITIGDGVVFMAAQDQNLVGLVNPTILCANKGGRIVIGSHTGLSSPVINARERVEIGSYVNVGGNVRIFDHDFHSLNWNDRRPPQNMATVRVSPVIIEDDCFIGTNAIILKGSHIGARSIVAAGSVVFGLKVPPDSLVKGNPAKIVCARDK